MARGWEIQKEMETQRARSGGGRHRASGDRDGSSSIQGDRGDTQIDPPGRVTRPADSKTATGRGQGGGGALPLPHRPLPGASRVAGGSARWGGRARPEAASWMQRFESGGAETPVPPVESSLGTGQCGCRGLPVRRSFARCGPNFPHSAEGNAEAARRLCARRLLPRPFLLGGVVCSPVRWWGCG